MIFITNQDVINTNLMSRKTVVRLTKSLYIPFKLIQTQPIPISVKPYSLVINGKVSINKIKMIDVLKNMVFLERKQVLASQIYLYIYILCTNAIINHEHATFTQRLSHESYNLEHTLESWHICTNERSIYDS